MDKIEIIKKILEKHPMEAYAWHLLGLEQVEKNNISEALKSFSEALSRCNDELRSDIFKQLSSLSQDNNYSSVEEKESILNEQESYEEYSDADSENVDVYNKQEDNIIPLRVISGGKSHHLDIDSENTSHISFDDVGGLDDLKDTIKMKIIKPFVNPSLFNKFKKKVGGGILLYGPPGCGKTFISKATAGECNANFIPVHITDILDPYLGVSAQNIKDIFSNARAKKPCILFFDEIDTIGYSRSKLSSEHMRPIVDQLLSEIEGIDSSTDKLLIMAATNMPWDVDSALKRPGRFDKTVFVPPPDEAARKIIFKLKMKDKPCENIDFNILAKNTELYSGADIENVVEVATENVLTDIMKTAVERSITMKDLLLAIENSKPSTIEWLRTIKNYIMYANQAGLYDDASKYINKYKKILY